MKGRLTPDPLPKVAIVIPTLNSARTLKRCLSSVEHLDYPDDKIEVLVVDGGSTDATVDVASNSKAKVITDPGSSRGGACNTGARHAVGTILAFTDADATVPPAWIGSIVREMTTEPVLDAIGGPDLGLKTGTIVGETVAEFDLFRRMKTTYAWKAVFKIKGVNSAYKTRFFLDLGGFDQSLMYGEESELHARMLSAGGRIKYNPEIVVFHERQQQSIRTLARSFRNSRLLAPLLFRSCTIKAALMDITSPLTTLLFLFVAICLGIPLLIVAYVEGYLIDLLLFAIIFVFAVCNLYAAVVIRTRRVSRRRALYFSTLLVLPIQSVLRTAGVIVGTLDLLANWTLKRRATKTA
jgi:cellulose synthase/poly-beta-1,6-N-acetylglucosamine synthase-like glycosyltransferase